MEKLDCIKKYIEVLKGKDEGRVIEALSGLNDIDRIAKNTVYTYLFPRPIQHMELPKLIMEGRGADTSGYLTSNDPETLILLRAYNTRQYGKYMRHLLHSFIQNTGSIFIENSPGVYECGSCGKKIYDYGSWKNICDNNPDFGEQNRREYLAYGSSQSSIHVCLDCMIQLQNLNNILEAIEGSNYLSLWKQ